MSRVEVNGVGYNVEVSGSGPSLLLLHGFTGDVTTWEPFVGPGKAFDGFTAIRVDVIGVWAGAGRGAARIEHLRGVE